VRERPSFVFLHSPQTSMEGGELYDRIVKKKRFSEEEARQALQMIASAVQYLHSLSIVHRCPTSSLRATLFFWLANFKSMLVTTCRDLKPENILYKGPPPNNHLVISDFGTSTLSCD